MREQEPPFKFAPEVTVVPVWDLGVRFFHWALVALIITSVVSIKYGKIDVHVWSGYGVLSLLVFRILWGFLGGTHARFASFIAGPGKVFAYMKGMFSRSGHEVGLGHNPMGALSVLAMLLVLLFQAVSGLFTNTEDFAFDGPLYKWVGKDWSDKITTLHRINEKVIYVLVALHLGAILFYFVWHKDNLVGSMITGYRKVQGAVSEARHGSTVLAVILLAVAVGVVYLVVNSVKLFGKGG